jgi:hypothetical protein
MLTTRQAADNRIASMLETRVAKCGQIRSSTGQFPETSFRGAGLIVVFLGCTLARRIIEIETETLQLCYKNIKIV